MKRKWALLISLLLYVALVAVIVILDHFTRSEAICLASIDLSQEQKPVFGMLIILIGVSSFISFAAEILFPKCLYAVLRNKFSSKALKILNLTELILASLSAVLLIVFQISLWASLWLLVAANICTVCLVLIVITELAVFIVQKIIIKMAN